MESHRGAVYNCEDSSSNWKKFFNLRWYAEDRQTRLKALKKEGSVRIDAAMGFDMFFDADKSVKSKVFFLEASLKEVVYVHLVSPYARLCKNNFDIQSAGNTLMMFDEHHNHGMMHPPRYSLGIRALGKNDNFWSTFGRDALVTVCEKNETLQGASAKGEAHGQERVVALIQKRRKRGKEEAPEPSTPRATMSSSSVVAGMRPSDPAVKKTWESEAFIPCMRFSEEKWRDCHDDEEESDKMYTEVRESRKKVLDDNSVVRKKDRVLLEGMTLKVTNWKDLVEEDEAHFAMLKARRF